MAAQPQGPADRLVLGLAWHGAIANTRMRAALGLTGLMPRHVMTLRWLADGPVSQKELIERLEVDPSVLVALLNDLEDGGLLQRRRDPADRRRHIVEITDSGRAALDTTDAALDELEAELFADLTASDLAALRRILGRLRSSAEHFECQEG
ncbi:MarR family winged helix-turn-helix transcriptional regulator [Yinghuangia seranimata]|uniref:MarR family winged helix-turn-helix transcriptional regulator n=1 Tax=Yinghuangia seranimata TaxID=408067 RepID=UPI00248C14B1|nr:MarR family winged helix-turn-helix transcriptional regulator [Yinghuangia seranimata]MDI2126130.1 MarR family winged helix-turn-helix transcriptional regulator [Yinghuangia seranimata]